MLRVLQTINGMSARSGGPSTCTKDLLDGLNKLTDVKADLLTVEDSANVGMGSPWLREVPFDYKTPLCWSSNIRRALKQSDYDIYHCNAIWMHSNHLTCSIARKKNKPYVLSPHGMLYPTALRVSSWKKWPMLKLWFYKDIMEASCIHATCAEEMKHVRAFGYKGPIAVIPNPVVIPSDISCKTTIPTRKAIGFLGRLNPIKKIENLLYAVSDLAQSGLNEFEVDIIGSGDENYERFLRNEAHNLGISERVNFLGFLSGINKYEALKQLWGLFVPSEQENFGMIVPEALICGTPVYASTGTPWSELNEYTCGWWAPNDPGSISEVIRELFEKQADELLDMGIQGRTLILEKYEQQKVAHMMGNLYRWLGGEAEKPDFVFD